MKYSRIKKLLQEKPVDQTIEVRGWVRTRRDAKANFSFLSLNDGSCLGNLQIIADDSLPNFTNEIRKLSVGCALRAVGILKDSPAAGQDVELLATEIEVYGWAPVETYPLQKKRHSFEFLREIAHLRPRTNSLGAVARVRSGLSQAIHLFFKERGFFYIHTPIITTSDCEGAGEMFCVTTLDLKNPPHLAENGQVDFSKDFFGRQANLTVSGQLAAEIYAMALGNVYTFGPTFRAENSNTSRHLAEFWMIEPEMAFCDLTDDIDLAEEFVKHLIREALAQFPEEIELFTRFVDPGLTERLNQVISRDFSRITYTEAVTLLEKSGRVFEYPVNWGTDLQSEHERFLTEEVFKQPIVVTDYPKSIKPFYMRENADGRTVANMDILFPGIGEIIGGSQREERLAQLTTSMARAGLNQQEYEWYLDLRRFGTAPHAGFGLGFERIIQFITGMSNIREVIPFPRTPGTADY